MGIFFVLLLFAIFSAVLASSKGRSGIGWFFVGLLFGPFGLLVGFMPPLSTSVKNSNQSNDIEDLKNLVELKEKGVFSDNEYEKRKQAILNNSKDEKPIDQKYLIYVLIIIIVLVLYATSTVSS